MDIHDLRALDCDAQADQALMVLAEVVAEAGEDHVDPLAVEGNCVYVAHDDNGQPYASCIAGRFFARLGVSLDTIHEHESTGADTVADALDLCYQTGMILRTAQAEQDDCKPWGLAQGASRAWLERYRASQTAEV